MKTQRVFLRSFGESSTVNGVPQPITEITRTYTHGPGIDNHLSFYYQHVQDGTLVEARPYYYGKNHKDIVMITDVAGQIAEDYEYDPWGEEFSNTATSLNKVQFLEMKNDKDLRMLFSKGLFYQSSTRLTLPTTSYQFHQIDVFSNASKYGDKPFLLYLQGSIKGKYRFEGSWFVSNPYEVKAGPAIVIIGCGLALLLQSCRGGGNELPKGHIMYKGKEIDCNNVASCSENFSYNDCLGCCGQCRKVIIRFDITGCTQHCAGT